MKLMPTLKEWCWDIQWGRASRLNLAGKILIAPFAALGFAVFILLFKCLSMFEKEQQ